VHRALAKIEAAFRRRAAAVERRLAARMGFALRRLDSGTAAVDSTIWSLAPVFYDDPGLKDFTVSSSRR
jgi:hypothetical protein